MHNDPNMDFAALTELLPDFVDGYRPDGDPRRYARDDLFELLNGGAEVYRSLNVRGAVSQVYANSEAPDVLVDVFDLGSSSDAYGAYHHDMREGPSAGVGHESEQAGCSVFFWKDRYFVSVVALADSDTSRRGVARIADALAQGIDSDGEVPTLVGWLPQRGLVTSQVHYFHTWSLLERHYHFAEDNLLLLDFDTEGVLARYRDEGDATCTGLTALMVVRYPSEERAEKAHQLFETSYLPGRDAEVTPFDENTWVGFVRHGEVLVGVFGAVSRQQVTDRLADVDRQREGAS
jgi:Family of unknown function (DUF6599)